MAINLHDETVIDPADVWWDGDSLTFPCPRCGCQSIAPAGPAWRLKYQCYWCNEWTPINHRLHKLSTIKKRSRIHLVDRGQDILYLDVVTCENGVGSVMDTNNGVHPLAKIFYIGKAVDLSDVHETFPLPLADPKNSFRVVRSIFSVLRVEDRTNFINNLEIITT